MPPMCYNKYRIYGKEEKNCNKNREHLLRGIENQISAMSPRSELTSIV